jgi:hypothetical protein
LQWTVIGILGLLGPSASLASPNKSEIESALNLYMVEKIIAMIKNMKQNFAQRKHYAQV